MLHPVSSERCDSTWIRRAAALAELYAWHRDSEPMMGRVPRDAPRVEPLGKLMEERWRALVAAADAFQGRDLDLADR